MEKHFSSFQLQGIASSLPSLEEEIRNDGRADAAASSCKSHSEAEKRRRDRINGQLQTLRKLTPKSEKMDKAALLAYVVQHIRGLKVKAAEACKSFTVPGDIDEITISTAEVKGSSAPSIYIEVRICCEDRPELFKELGTALKNLKLSIVQSEIATLGCRVQVVLLLTCKENVCNNANANANEDLGLLNLKRALKASLNGVANSNPSASSYRVASKRQRFFFGQG